MRLARLIALAALVAGCYARVIQVVVETREPLANTPHYERLAGYFTGELDPGDPHNSIINDIGLAPRNTHGDVEYRATFTLLRPAGELKASGILWYEVPNRGNSPLNQRLPADALAAGHILVSSGWQGDLAPRPKLETIAVPAARNRDGSPITGPVVARLTNLPPDSPTASLETGFAALRYQRPATLDTTRTLLTVQASDDGQRIVIAPSDWAFGNCDSKPFPGEPDPARICVKGGFHAGLLYELTYTAKDPLVLGVGLAATRDLVSWLRSERGPGNPVAGLVRHTVAFGTSQSGNFLKSLIHLGFNQDETGHRVFDGANPNIAGRQVPLNIRFGTPGGAAELYEPGSEGVLWWSAYRDEARGRAPAGLLDRCRATKTCPKIMETFGSTEFWGLKMSPGLVGTRADTDIPLPPEVRRYYFPGVTHGGGPGGFRSSERPGTVCALPNNPNPSADSMRALRRALTEWVVNGTEPPPSRYPSLAAGDLVPPARSAMGFPAIPGRPLPDGLINTFYIYDFGPGFRYNDLSGAIAAQPPPVLGVVPQLVPRTDADGNEIGGIPSVLHRAPLGTYLGWNVMAAGYRKGRLCGFSGGFIPFAKTKAERETSGDPRPSLEEHYGTHEGYVIRVREAARTLVQERFLLPDDAERIVREAEASDVLR